MYKMLVVDDFIIDRENVNECIDWESFQIAIGAEANHGVEALEYLENHACDILLTDVQMPFMDGIELAKKASELYPNIKIIFMSYYNDFEYLKSAIDLNAYGYILKPYVAEEVEDVVTKLIKKMNEEVNLRKMLDESRPLLINRFYKNIFDRQLTEENKILLRAKFLKQNLNPGYFQVILIKRYVDSTHSIEDYYVTDMQMNLKLNVFCHKYQVPITGVLEENHYFIILTREKQEAMIQLNIDFVDDLQDFINTSMQQYTIGISSMDHGIEAISRLYEEAGHALRSSFYKGKCQMIHYEEVADRAMTPEHIQLNCIQEDIKILVTSGNRLDMHNFVKDMYAGCAMTKDHHHLDRITHSIGICMQIVFAELGEEESRKMNEEIWPVISRDFSTLNQMITSLTDVLLLGANYYKDQHKRKKNKVIEAIITYVDKNYMLDITVKDIAEEIFYSPNYLNGLFKKKMERSIPDYITEYRVNKAKELLDETNMKIYEIIEVVGYKRASHFNNIFKRYVGVTPKAYRGE